MNLDPVAVNRQGAFAPPRSGRMQLPFAYGCGDR